MILKLSTRLYKAQKGLCFHCGKEMSPNPVRKKGKLFTKGWTREHVIPIAHGGKNKNNVVLAHVACNGKRGTNTLSRKALLRATAIIKEANEYHFKPPDKDTAVSRGLKQGWVLIVKDQPDGP